MKSANDSSKVSVRQPSKLARLTSTAAAKENTLPGRPAATKLRAPLSGRTAGSTNASATPTDARKPPSSAGAGRTRPAPSSAGGSASGVRNVASAVSRGRSAAVAAATATGAGSATEERRPPSRPGRGRGPLRPRGMATVGVPPVFTGPDKKELHPAIVKSTRRTGQLNLSNKELGTVPDKVWRINEIDNEEAKQLTMTSDSEERWWDQVPLTKLLLPGNRLTEISDDIALLTNLHTLDLHDNSLTQLPAALSQLGQLQRLVVSHNQLRQLPAMSSLRQLLADHNQLTELPDQLGDCLDLELLDVSQNALTTLPPSLGYLHKVSSLNASDNQLLTVPDELGDMTRLRHLDLSRNRLTILPAGLGQLAQLETLRVHQNQLQQLPQLASCRALKELHAGYNQIQDLDVDVLEGLKTVVILDLSNNRIELLPDEVVCMQRLERLDLRNNSLTVAPARLCLLPLLKSVQLEGNAVRSLRADLLRGGTQQLLKHFRDRLRGQAKADGISIPGLEDEPDASERAAAEEQSRLHELYKMKSSRLCVFTGQKAAEVPPNLLEMAAEAEVTSVDLSQNVINAVPDGVLELHAHLSELNVSGNRLTSVPSGLARCCHLAYLNVSGNQLAALPDSMAALAQLREVVLSMNKFAAIPPVLYSLPALEILLISDNQVAEVEWEPLRRLSRLATLDLRNNSIGHVPAKLGTLTQLRSLNLEGNTFKQPRATILAQGTATVLQYLRDRIPMAEREA